MNFEDFLRGQLENHFNKNGRWKPEKWTKSNIFFRDGQSANYGFEKNYFEKFQNAVITPLRAICRYKRSRMSLMLQRKMPSIKILRRHIIYIDLETQSKQNEMFHKK